MRGSLPYMLLLATIGLALGIFFWGVNDFLIGEFVALDVWHEGSPETMAGRERMLAMWDHMPIILVTGISLSLLWASRRGRA